VGEIDKDLQGVRDDVMGFFPFDVAGHADTARVVFHLGAVKPRRDGKSPPVKPLPGGAIVGTLLDHGIAACRVRVK
jgi:hypothetical protein